MKIRELRAAIAGIGTEHDDLEALVEVIDVDGENHLADIVDFGLEYRCEDKPTLYISGQEEEEAEPDEEDEEESAEDDEDLDANEDPDLADEEDDDDGDAEKASEEAGDWRPGGT